MSEAELMKVLSENFGNLHPLSRLIVRGCVGRPFLLAGASATLRGWLRLGEHVPAERLSKGACSVLANLLYWGASAETLGAATMRRVFRDEAGAGAAPSSL
jgi:hypothetical protein